MIGTINDESLPLARKLCQQHGIEFSDEELSSWLRCPTCSYLGPVSGWDGTKANFDIITPSGEKKTIDLGSVSASGESKNLKHLTEVIEDEGGKGVLRVGDIRCPKCDLNEIYVILMQTRSSDEPETKICTCKNCGKRFREYQ